jgi:hypothetical protein
MTDIEELQQHDGGADDANRENDVPDAAVVQASRRTFVQAAVFLFAFGWLLFFQPNNPWMVSYIVKHGWFSSDIVREFISISFLNQVSVCVRSRIKFTRSFRTRTLVGPCFAAYLVRLSMC